VMHSGYLPAALKGNREISVAVKPQNLEGKEIFMAHGEYDAVVPTSLGRATYEYLVDARANVIYREYPIGHAISEESLYDASEWLTRLIK
jgi:phospholipase/carboxylesterase